MSNPKVRIENFHVLCENGKCQGKSFRYLCTGHDQCGCHGDVAVKTGGYLVTDEEFVGESGGQVANTAEHIRYRASVNEGTGYGGKYLAADEEFTGQGGDAFRGNFGVSGSRVCRKAGATSSCCSMTGPIWAAMWLFFVIGAFAVVVVMAESCVIYLRIGARSLIALAGFLVMQVGLWHAENKWDEKGSAAWCGAANGDTSAEPEELDRGFALQLTSDTECGSWAEAHCVGYVISDCDLRAAFPTPWCFLIGWCIWGACYMFPVDGLTLLHPTWFGIAAFVICVFIGIVASFPMVDAVIHRKDGTRKCLSVILLLLWIALAVMSILDVLAQVCAEDMWTRALIWFLWILGPITVIMSQQVLVSARKMGSVWNTFAKPNFCPIVCNMGGPLYVWGWFMIFLGTCGAPGFADESYIFLRDPEPGIPLFLNLRTLASFLFGCGIVSVVHILGYAHDEGSTWLGTNDKGEVFRKWWRGTDGTYFGVFLESPWPLVMCWLGFGFSCMLTYHNEVHTGIREVVIFMNCALCGIVSGILIQQNVYARNIFGSRHFSSLFVLLFVVLAINIGSRWYWKALALSLPGAILIVLAYRAVFGASKRGDYTMHNNGKSTPYDRVFVYTLGEPFFMLGWILICWGMALPW